jgi:hypothetical protein
VKTSYLLPFLSVLSLGAAGACDPADDTAAEPECDVRYKDADGDRKGDPSAPTTDCVPGPGFVDNSDDCDDANPYVNADETEICDGFDNDCRATTGEENICKKAECIAAVNPATKAAYLFCSAPSWLPGAPKDEQLGDASKEHEQLMNDRCGAYGFSPAKVEDQAENDFLVEQIRTISAVRGPAVIALGGFRSGGVWRWADGAQFWPDPRTDGVAPYTDWTASPTNDAPGECLSVLATIDQPGWAPVGCEEAQVVVCERAEHASAAAANLAAP